MASKKGRGDDAAWKRESSGLFRILHGRQMSSAPRACGKGSAAPAKATDDGAADASSVTYPAHRARPRPRRTCGYGTLRAARSAMTTNTSRGCRVNISVHCPTSMTQRARDVGWEARDWTLAHRGWVYAGWKSPPVFSPPFNSMPGMPRPGGRSPDPGSRGPRKRALRWGGGEARTEGTLTGQTILVLPWGQRGRALACEELREPAVPPAGGRVVVLLGGEAEGAHDGARGAGGGHGGRGGRLGTGRVEEAEEGAGRAREAWGERARRGSLVSTRAVHHEAGLIEV